jgi:hypothetical protein
MITLDTPAQAFGLWFSRRNTCNNISKHNKQLIAYVWTRKGWNIDKSVVPSWKHYPALISFREKQLQSLKENFQTVRVHGLHIIDWNGEQDVLKNELTEMTIKLFKETTVLTLCRGCGLLFM